MTPEPSLTSTARPQASGDPLAESTLRTLAYAAIFGFPLAADEVHRYLVARRAEPQEVSRALERLVAAGRARGQDGFFGLEGADLGRRWREAPACDRAWRRARRWGHAIARLPFVRMVAVTGALAAENPDGGDFDYFVVTRPGRLWLCRAWIIQRVVRPARLFGDVVCPNYLLAEDRLAFAERDAFVAREVAQMVPLAGFDVYRRLRDENAWVERLLPNAAGPPPRVAETEDPGPRSRSRFELALSGRLGERLERWERTRKIAELERRHGRGRVESELHEGACKGHFSEHGRRILAAWRERLDALDLSAPPTLADQRPELSA